MNLKTNLHAGETNYILEWYEATSSQSPSDRIIFCYVSLPTKSKQGSIQCYTGH